MIRRTDAGESGFTLVELLLALAFVGFLLIFVLTATIEVVSNYNKGVVIKEINQSARAIVEDMSRVIRSSEANAINTSALANGRVCFGSISYIWNLQSATVNRYTDNSIVSLVRVEDPAGSLCIRIAGNYPLVDQARATTLINSRMWVQRVDLAISTDQLLATATLRLSTSNAGNNHPTVSSPNGLVCAGGRSGSYCAVAEFTTTANIRN